MHSNKEEKLRIKCLLFVYKLIVQIVENQDHYSNTLKLKILNCEILDLILKNLTADDVEGDDFYNSYIQNSSKIMLEVCLLIVELEKSALESSCIFKYPKISQFIKYKKVLGEMKQFDLISYLLYYKKEILDNDNVSTKTCIETLHNWYKTKTIAKYEFEGPIESKRVDD